jgi:poly(A) polymerase
MRRSTQVRFLRLPGFEEHLELHRLDCLASHGDLSTYEMAKRLLEETPAEEIRPAPLLRGDDLIAQGYSPGPVFKEILRAVEDAQLDGKIHTPTEALSLVVECFPPSRPHKTSHPAAAGQQSAKSERGDSRN